MCFMASWQIYWEMFKDWWSELFGSRGIEFYSEETLDKIKES